jgi:hypothetical protein
MSEPKIGHVDAARRDLYREQMTEQAHELTWLGNPDLIPETAIHYADGPESSVGEYFNLAHWMVDQFAEWATAGHARLGLLKAFEKHDLSNEERIRVRNAFQNKTAQAYAPGVVAMSEIFAAVPGVARRGGVPRSQWSTIASQAREFGGEYARSGTLVQCIVRGYLGAFEQVGVHGEKHLDQAKLTLDAQTGITSVTPIENIVAAAEAVVGDARHPESRSDACIGLQANPQGLEASTMYDAAWNAFGSAAERLIYPLERPVEGEITEAEQPEQGDLYPIMVAVLKRELDAIEANKRAARLAQASLEMSSVLIIR